MIRIVGGVAGGRRLAVPPGTTTRPTADRAREALFSSLAASGDLDDGVRVLDLYAGSGAVGLEALSRGAAEATLVEANDKVLAVLRKNVADLKLPGADVIAGKVGEVLTRPAPRAHELVFADPPYALAAADLTRALIDGAVNGWIADDALVVVERSSRDEDWQWPDGFDPVRSKRYGEAVFVSARHTGTPDRGVS